MRTRGAALAPAAALAVLAVPGTTWAAAPLAGAVAGTDRDQAAADRFFVRWLSNDEPRPAVRSAARGALLSSAGEAAIADFLNVGWDAAIARDAQALHQQALAAEAAMSEPIG